MRAAFLTPMFAVAVAACADDGGPGPGGGFERDGGVIVWRPGDAGVIRDAGDGDQGSTDLDRDAGPDLGSDDAGASDDLGGIDMGPDPCLAPVERVTTATGAAAGGVLVGRVVQVEGLLAAGPPECEGEACGPDEPCCQSCTATVRLDGVLDLEASDCAPFSAGCRGNNCSLSCSPPLLGVPVVFRGRVLDGGRLEVLEQLR